MLPDQTHANDIEEPRTPSAPASASTPPPASASASTSTPPPASTSAPASASASASTPPPASAANLRFASRLWSSGLSSTRSAPLIVAEISTNHRGSLDEACALVAAASRAGADAVKIQSYSASDLTIESPRAEFLLSHPLWSGRRLFELYSEGGLPASWHGSLWRTASEHNIAIFPSIFSRARLELLEHFSPPAYKIASSELVDIPLISSIARTGRGVILSTGMGDLAEISRAVSAIRAASDGGLLLLHCLSAYPAPSDAMNLRAIGTLSREFSCAVGLSDHTTSDRAAVQSVGLGVSLIEKHFTLERRASDLDAAFSLTEAEFAAFVMSIREAWRAMGSGALELSEQERSSLPFRRSLYVVKSLRRGEVFSAENIRSIRPSAGLEPRHYERVLGKRAAADITAGEPLREEMLEEAPETDKTKTTSTESISTVASAVNVTGDVFSDAYARSAWFRKKGLAVRTSELAASERASCLAVIPARGGSKRISDKNIVDFFGKPLLAHTLGYSLGLVGESGIFTKAHVSTDSERIAGVVRAAGGKIDFMREARLADDFTGVWDVVRWVLEEYQRRGERFACVCLLYSCTPLLEASDLRGGMDYFLSLGQENPSGYNSGYHVMACCEYMSSPMRAMSMDTEGNIRAMDEASSKVLRSQDLGSYVMDCGAFSYRWTEDVLNGVEALQENKTRAYLLDREKGVDINNERDLEFAKTLYRAKN